MTTLLKESVAIFEGKKTVGAHAKVSQEEFDAYSEIGKATDRSFSYVLRELAVRGYIQYLKDGHLKPSKEEEEAVSQFLGNVKNTSVEEQLNQEIIDHNESRFLFKLGARPQNQKRHNQTLPLTPKVQKNKPTADKKMLSIKQDETEENRKSG